MAPCFFMLVTAIPELSLKSLAADPEYMGPVIKEDGQVTFYYQGDGSEESVYVKGSWDWNDAEEGRLNMTKGSDNLWSVTTTNLKKDTSYEYGIMVDGNWVNDSANANAEGNSKIMRNPTMDADGNVKLYYYPTHGTYPTVKVEYQKEGTDTWQSAEMTRDSVNTEILSATLDPEVGTYEYKILVDGEETEDLSAADTQTFTVSDIPQEDPNAISPEVTETSVIFRYYGPTAKSVFLAGSMNGWSDSADPMTYNSETGYWSIEKTLAAGSYEYKFVVDGTWTTDPLNAEESNGNSLVNVTAAGDVKSPVINNSGTTFLYQAPDAESVQLAGSMTEWQTNAVSMVKDEESGYWVVTLPLAAGDYEYKFIVNGDQWTTDPLNAESANGNSAFTVTGEEQYKSPVIGEDSVLFVYETEDETLEQVRLAGTMTDWQNNAEELVEIEKTEEETIRTFELEKDLDPGRYEYKYILGEDNWINDPENQDVNSGGNNTLLVPGLANKTDSASRGKDKELPEVSDFYAGDSEEPHKVKVEYELTEEAEGVSLNERTLSVAEDCAAESVTLKMTAETFEAEMVIGIVDAQYTYTFYYYDEAHNTLDSADLWIWENNGEGATEGRAFQEECVLEDGRTWLKATYTLPYTDLGIIPRSKGSWDWQSATVNYVNETEAEEVTIYMIADDSTAYTELPEIQEVEDRYLVVEYQRPEGDYDGWNIYTWNSGFGSEVQIDSTTQGDDVVFIIPIKPTTGSVSFVMRKGPEDNPFESKDGGDHSVETPLDQRVVRATFVQDEGIQYVYPYNAGYELDVEADQVHFYYRDDELFLNGTGADLEGKVQVETDGETYEMTYDEETGRYVYSLDGIVEGEHTYRYIVDGEILTDSYNEETTEVDGTTYSVYRYQTFEGEASAEVTPASITPSENAVLKVTVPEAEGMEIASITADASAIGGKAEMEISPELNAVTLSVADTLAAGTYTIPVCVKDQYGNVYRTEAEIAVEAGSTDWDEAVIYFMVTDRFFNGNSSNDGENYDPENPGMYHGGDFAGVTAKLDYLQNLGVNTIWITPIVENISEGQNTGNEDVPQTVGYHGYWSEDFTTLDSHLGTEDEFRTLIEEAHSRDMKIMVDVVLNHAGYGTEDIYGDMLRGSEDTVSGDEVKDSLSGLPDFRTEDAEVRNQLIDWQTAWVSEFDIDYFRVDTVKHVEDTTWQAFKNALTEVNPDFKMIGEYSGAGYTFDGGQLKSGQMDSLLDFDFNNAGIDLGTGNLQKLESFLENRNDSLSSDATLGSFLSSHDEDGLMYDYINDLGMTEERAREMMKVAASMQITAKGQPVIYYGEELGQSGANNYPYQTNRYDLDWDSANEDNDMLTHYKNMLRIRQDYSSVLAKGDRTGLLVDEEQGVMVFDRSYGDQHVITALNTSEEAQTVTFTLPEDVTAVKGNIYESAEGTSVSVQDGTVTIEVPAAEDGGTYVLVSDAAEEPDVPEEPEKPGFDFDDMQDHMQQMREKMKKMLECIWKWFRFPSFG